jgi:hypothetical protein
MRTHSRPHLDEVEAQFETWRAGGHGRRAFPERLWRAAVGLLDRYPPSVVCQRLRLNATRFARVREALGSPPAKVPAAFVELPALHGLAAPTIAMDGSDPSIACRVVLDTAAGARLSVELAQVDAVTLAWVCRSMLAAGADARDLAHSCTARP